MNFTQEAKVCVVCYLIVFIPWKTREVKFTRVFFRKAREILRAAMFVTSLMEQACYGLHLRSWYSIVSTNLLQVVHKLATPC